MKKRLREKERQKSAWKILESKVSGERRVPRSRDVLHKLAQRSRLPPTPYPLNPTL